MSASTHWLATATAQSVLERGGNAADAAVAAGFVLHVVEPHLNGPGGDLVGLVHMAGDPEGARVLMGQGPAPHRATITRYRDEEGLVDIPGSGALAAAVPGAVDAWLLLLAQHGTWDLADVLEYAIDLAENGHPVLERVCTTIEAMAAYFHEHWPSSEALWCPQGQVPRPGELIRNPEYAQVLRELVAAGEAATTPERVARIEAARVCWRTGRVAQEIARFVTRPHRHGDGRDHAGVLTVEDLAAPVARFEAPVRGRFRDVEILKAGTWTQGPVLLEALALLDPLPDDHLDPPTADGAHHVLEALKLALADRDAWYGEDGPDASVLLETQRIEERRQLIGRTARAGGEPGDAAGRAPWTPTIRAAESSAPLSGEPTVRVSRADGTPGGVSRTADTPEPPTPATAESRAVPTDAPEPPMPRAERGDTCHLDVVDRWGNVVAITPSGGWLQSSPTIPGLGFCLGTRLQMCWLDEASPSALRPGARPRTTLSPTLVQRDGRTIIAMGTPGGDQQDQWQLPLLLRLLVQGVPPQQAIDAPMLHTTACVGSFAPRQQEPYGVVVENRLGEEVIAELEARGHRVTRAGDWSLGRLSVVTRDPDTGILQATANPRGAQGYAAGR
ncbi:gamma-glutamyltransferase [Brachybacterium sp. EF45031]|nr:gamma-glutamyltransferase family protein [Brachybacterium sillae]MCS6710793.1 gamma-glutamyltransferase [Brachybacterium sillae]